MYELKTLFSIIDFSTKNIVSLIKFLCDELACCKFEAWIIDIIDRIDTDTIVKMIINIVDWWWLISIHAIIFNKTTQKIVQAVVKEVTKVETVAELSEEEKTEVGQVLGFTEEEASEDLTIIAEQAAEDENTAQALDEFVERSIASSEVENYTLADVVTEVQIEAFLENPVAEIFSVNLDELDISTVGNDMTSDQREKAQEVVVPVIIASQIIAQAGALMRRF